MIYVIIWVLCGLAAAAIYRNKGRSAGVAFVAGVLFGPIAVLLALISSTDKSGLEQQQLTTGGMQKCPFCAELIKGDAVVCRYCGRDIPKAALPNGVARVVPKEGGWACSGCGGFVRQDATTCKHCGKPLIISAAVYASGRVEPPATPPTT